MLPLSHRKGGSENGVEYEREEGSNSGNKEEVYEGNEEREGADTG